MQAKAKLKRWGNSFGVMVPKEIVEKEGLKEGELVEISVRKASDISHLFGKYPIKNLQQQKEAMRKGWEGDLLKFVTSHIKGQTTCSSGKYSRNRFSSKAIHPR